MSSCDIAVNDVKLGLGLDQSVASFNNHVRQNYCRVPLTTYHKRRHGGGEEWRQTRS